MMPFQHSHFTPEYQGEGLHETTNPMACHTISCSLRGIRLAPLPQQTHAFENVLHSTASPVSAVLRSWTSPQLSQVAHDGTATRIGMNVGNHKQHAEWVCLDMTTMIIMK
jgi:hypothetical protein